MLTINWTQDRPSMKVNRKNDLVWLSYPELDRQDWLVNGFSTRLGGVSEGMFSSMNLSFTRGDDPEAVMENYNRIGEGLGFRPEWVAASDQIHAVNLRVVGEKDRGKGVTGERDYSGIDGLLTNVPGVVLATFFADCVPLYFVDPVHKAIALSHSGWRGTVQRMGRETIRRMQKEYGTDPEDLFTAIGPSICQDCYEVSEDVIEAFRQEFPDELHERLFYPTIPGKYQLNLWEANRQILLDAGVREERIHLPGLCTCCNPELLFSHRASKGKRGNLAAFLFIKDSVIV
ncbi:MAG: peptidoglycan editing factor PgeF [Lachnospiraceae bacterium]|nr:peptidoglycan editing factor PgeF [Lachnospiraceae bacterium]